MIPTSLYVPGFPNKKVRAIRIWAQTRGAGHSLQAFNTKYTLVAQPA